MPDERERPSLDPGTAPTLRSHGLSGARRSTSANEGERERTLLDDFEVVGELGRGGMGLVVAVRDADLGRTVALKLLYPKLAESAFARRRFIVEAQVAAQLEHPNIVPVYGLEREGEAPAFTMRLLPGTTLEARIGEPIPEGTFESAFAERAAILLKACDAVAYAHSRGVIHRDIKPENILIGDHGEVYLADWGVAKVLGDEDAPDQAAWRPKEPPKADGSAAPGFDAAPGLDYEPAVSIDPGEATQHGALVGTATYMPPEQAAGRLDEHGPRSDVFALGMVLQHLITSERPREGALVDQIFQATRGERRALDARADGRPADPALRAIVTRATEVDPEARYPDVAAFSEDLRRYLRGDPVSVYPEPTTKRLWRQLSRRPGLTLGVVGVLLLVASIAVSLSLAHTVRMERRAAAQSERLSRWSGQVVRQSEAINGRLARARLLVESLGVRTEELYARGGLDEGEPPFGVAGRLVGERGPRLEGLGEVERYGDMPVTFAMPLYLYPPGVSYEAIEPTLRRMAPLAARFEETLVRSIPGGLGDRSPRSALEAGAADLHVTYIGLESGLLLNYPGYEPFPDAYDPRRRSWYREARERGGPHFGAPYPDASGSAILVPCNRRLSGPDGSLIGVAGADMALDDLVRAIRFDDPAWRRSSLVDVEGRQILDTDQEGLRLGVDLHDDAPLEARPLAPGVWAAIERHETGWTHDEADGSLVVFSRLTEVDWTLTVHLDARSTLEP